MTVINPSPPVALGRDAARLGTIGARPAGRFVGDIYFDNDSAGGAGCAFIWTGSAWQQFSLYASQTTNSTLINGTGNILPLAVPNDGNRHLVAVHGYVNTSGATTGGQVSLNYTLNGAQSLVLDPGSHGGAGVFPFAQCVVANDPGGALAIAQTTALTVGAAVVQFNVSIL